MGTPIEPMTLAFKVAAGLAFLAFVALRPSPFLRIVAACFVGQVVYAMVQDQFSARLCVEYFTVLHPRIGTLDDPTMLGLAWGFLAGSSGGMAMGLVVGIAATFGKRPPVGIDRLWRPLLLLFLAEAAVTALCGASAYLNAGWMDMRMAEPTASVIPADRRLNCFAVGCAHLGTYVSAIVGSIVVVVWVLRARRPVT
ncbi:MAG: hypothetical protein U0746_13600 [Gemmataceae bacterium]